MIQDPLVHDILVTHILNELKNLYKTSYKLNPRDSIVVFQVALRNIPDISESKLEQLYEEFLNKVKESDNDEDYITRIFELNFRNVVRYLMETDKGLIVTQEIPISLLNISASNQRMLFHFYLESARGVWTHANLFSFKYPEEEQVKNLETLKNIVRNSIIRTVQKRVDLNEVMDYYTNKKEEKEKEEEKEEKEKEEEKEEEEKEEN